MQAHPHSPGQATTTKLCVYKAVRWKYRAFPLRKAIDHATTATKLWALLGRSTRPSCTSAAAAPAAASNLYLAVIVQVAVGMQVQYVIGKSKHLRSYGRAIVFPPSLSLSIER